MCGGCKTKAKAKWNTKGNPAEVYFGCWVSSLWIYSLTGKLQCLQCKISGSPVCNVEDMLATAEQAVERKPDQQQAALGTHATNRSCFPANLPGRKDSTNPQAASGSGANPNVEEADVRLPEPGQPDWPAVLLNNFIVTIDRYASAMSDGRQITKNDYRVMMAMYTTCESMPKAQRGMMQTWMQPIEELIDE